jgi:hypothetical protein
MPDLLIGDFKNTRNKKDYLPIAIVKGDDNKFHNKFLYLNDKDDVKATNTEIEIPMGCIFNLIPNADKDKRDCFYIAGASGSGKSWIARQLAENYTKMYPGRPIYLISKLDADDTIDNAKADIERLEYKNWMENPPNVNEINNCMVIFDDVDTIDKKEGGDAVQLFADDIATTGRKHGDTQGNITMLYISHNLTNYKKSRLLLLESTHYVIYPQNTSPHALKYLLRTHVGMDDDAIKKLKKLGSRWVCIRKGFPSYLISSHKAQLLFQDD